MQRRRWLCDRIPIKKPVFQGKMCYGCPRRFPPAPGAGKERGKGLGAARDARTIGEMQQREAVGSQKVCSVGQRTPRQNDPGKEH